MKQTRAPKTARQTRTDTRQDASAGRNGISLAPPAYGMDFLDRGFTGSLAPPAPVQLQPDLEEEELLQGKLDRNVAPTQFHTTSAAGEDRTGMPVSLKAGLEQLSDLDLSGVRVHYNSDKPAQLNALAYTHGQDIEVGPGQERHLPHEAWHVVQQMQGRVQPTMQAKGVAINDDPALEREADLMGEKAATQKSPDRFPARQGKSVTNEGGSKPLSVSARSLAQAIGSSYGFNIADIPISAPRSSAGQAPTQLKPSNVDKTESLVIKGSNGGGKITNDEAERADVPVSFPMNRVADLLSSTQVPTSDQLKGGHLFKREWGGSDDFKNVMTWSKDVEGSGTGKKKDGSYTEFENYFEAQCKNTREDITTSIKTEATFSSENHTQLAEKLEQSTDENLTSSHKEKLTSFVNGSLETIPSKVKVTATIPAHKSRGKASKATQIDQEVVTWTKDGKANMFEGWPALTDPGFVDISDTKLGLRIDELTHDEKNQDLESSLEKLEEAT